MYLSNAEFKLLLDEIFQTKWGRISIKTYWNTVTCEWYTVEDPTSHFCFLGIHTSLCVCTKKIQMGRVEYKEMANPPPWKWYMVWLNYDGLIRFKKAVSKSGREAWIFHLKISYWCVLYTVALFSMHFFCAFSMEKLSLGQFQGRDPRFWE